jgi:VanZ family protein
LAVFVGGVILFLSAYPGSEIPKVPIKQADKFVHILMYTVFTFSMLIPYAAQYLAKKKRFTSLTKVALLVFAYGGLMEVLQATLFSNRSGNWQDLWANLIGVITGVLFFLFVIKKTSIFGTRK